MIKESKQRKNLKKAKPNQIQEKKEEHTAPIQTDLRAISLDDVLSFLATQKDVAAENIELKQKVESLVEKNKELEETLSELKAKYQVIKTDYQLMMDIMNRAIQLTV